MTRQQFGLVLGNIRKFGLQDCGDVTVQRASRLAE
jgi:hypothetical protein